MTAGPAPEAARHVRSLRAASGRFGSPQLESLRPRTNAEIPKPAAKAPRTPVVKANQDTDPLPPPPSPPPPPPSSAVAAALATSRGAASFLAVGSAMFCPTTTRTARIRAGWMLHL